MGWFDLIHFALPRPSPGAHEEALWKQEGTKCCRFLRNHAHDARRAGGSNWRKCRRNTQTSAIVHGSFGTTHNLKVVGSNPTPATISAQYIKCLADGILIPQAILHFTSTPRQHTNRKIAFACTRTHRRALARIRGSAGRRKCDPARLLRLTLFDKRRISDGSAA